MKLTAPENPNYAAVVVKLLNIVPLENCDNVVGTVLFNSQAIVSKNYQVGDMGLYFPAETQLSEEFTKENNLYRHSEQNKDTDQAGYMEDNRRVKAMKFRKHRSDALFMPLSSLAFTKVDIDNLKVGDTFDFINGHEICKKFLRKIPGTQRVSNQEKAFRRVDSKYLPEHYDTENFFRNEFKIKKGTNVIVTQKLHGTSIRIGNTIAVRNMNAFEKLFKRLGAKIQDTEFLHVSGSKRVIKDPDNQNQVHYYEVDIWTAYGEKLKGLIPQNVVVYGELIGYTQDGGEIQSKYTYGLPEKTSELYIYRVAVVTQQGKIYDFAWPQVKEFCQQIGVKHVPELWTGPIEKLTKIVDKKTGQMAISRDFLEKRYKDIGYDNAVWLGNNKLVDEGVVVRVDHAVEGNFPYSLKAKSPTFLGYESDQTDKGGADLETSAN